MIAKHHAAASLPAAAGLPVAARLQASATRLPAAAAGALGSEAGWDAAGKTSEVGVVHVKTPQIEIIRSRQPERAQLLLCSIQSKPSKPNETETCESETFETRESETFEEKKIGCNTECIFDRDAMLATDNAGVQEIGGGAFVKGTVLFVLLSRRNN